MKLCYGAEGELWGGKGIYGAGGFYGVRVCGVGIMHGARGFSVGQGHSMGLGAFQ